MTERRLSERTVANYRLALEELTTSAEPQDIETIEPAQVRRAIAQLAQRGQAPRSIRSEEHTSELQSH